MSKTVQTIGVSIKITQELSEFDKGHWHAVIEDPQGNILTSRFSTGAPDDRLDMKDVEQMLKEFFRDYWRDKKREEEEANE